MKTINPLGIYNTVQIKNKHKAIISFVMHKNKL
jgi:hypothetical protein